MQCFMIGLFCLLTGFAFIRADLFLHIPRGSNNRLNERSAQRTNANRLFDSQNNGRGGYNVGDAGATKAQDESQQYRMKYFQSGPWKTLSEDNGKSQLTIEWTNQHGCGENDANNLQKQNCVMVLQYMCQDDVDSPTGTADTLRNGKQTAKQNYKPPSKLDETEQESTDRKSASVSEDRGLHEPWQSYDSCYSRERNKGLFTADRKLQNNKLGYSAAVYTRQNAKGDRYGYECPEERDYYPYWHPTSWKDIAVFAEKSSLCAAYISRSFNSHAYGECVEMFKDSNKRRYTTRWNNAAECQENGALWVNFYNYLEKDTGRTSQSACESASPDSMRRIWAVPHDATDVTRMECLVALDAPHCIGAPWSRSNHLGNGVDGIALNYTWILPYFPSGQTKRCVYRMRYNVSTEDYDPYSTDYKHNQDSTQGRISPVTDDPYVDVGASRGLLRLAIDPKQFGRIFQDRSHVFILRPRPAGMQQARIFNLNVRGKRGNIVQVYPAVEYDFHPNQLEITHTDIIHIQWTGSNSHNNGNPAGDGQTGSDGQGQAGTDRNNFLELRDLNDNFPLPFEQSEIWKAAEVMWVHHGIADLSQEDLAINMASSGYYRCVNCGVESVETKMKLNALLNNAPASYEGVMLRFKSGIYHYMCSRNNNYTNRSQKGTIIVR